MFSYAENMRRAAEVACKKAAPGGQVTQNYPESLQNDYYMVFLSDPKNNYKFPIISVKNEGIEVLDRRNNQRKNIIITNEFLSNYDFYLNHFYRSYIYAINDPVAFNLMHPWYPHYYVMKERVSQYFHNKTEVIYRNKIGILEYLLDKAVDSDDPFTSNQELINFFHTNRWGGRPEGERIQAYYQLVLAALVDDGNVEIKNKFHFKITPKGINTINEYQIEERRHKDNVKTQRYIVVLTLILAFIGIFQLFSSKELIDNLKSGLSKIF